MKHSTDSNLTTHAGSLPRRAGPRNQWATSREGLSWS